MLGISNSGSIPINSNLLINRNTYVYNEFENMHSFYIYDLFTQVSDILRGMYASKENWGILEIYNTTINKDYQIFSQKEYTIWCLD